MGGWDGVQPGCCGCCNLKVLGGRFYTTLYKQQTQNVSWGGLSTKLSTACIYAKHGEGGMDELTGKHASLSTGKEDRLWFVVYARDQAC